MGFININVLVILFLWRFWKVSAQVVGVDICACQPSIVTFQLNFTIDCDASNVEGPGITETTCIPESPLDESVTDLVPTIITLVKVFELDENLQTVGNTAFDEGYFDGDEITYTSIVIRDPESINASSIPRGFQVVLTGLNAAEAVIETTLAITYNGDCGIFPLLDVGEQIGWIVFTDLGIPPEQFCPIAGSSPPSLSPSEAPLEPLSDMPSDSPTAAPPITSPSTEAPVPLETESPIDSPTDVTAPSCPPISDGSMMIGGMMGGKGEGMMGGKGGESSMMGGKGGDSNQSMMGGKGEPSNQGMMSASSGGKGGNSDSEGKAGGMSGGMSGMGGKGISEESSNGSTEDVERQLRTGGGDECPEPEPNTPPGKKDMSMSGDKYPKDDVPKSGKGSKGMAMGKGSDLEPPDNDGKGGKGGDGNSTSNGKGGKGGDGKGGKGGDSKGGKGSHDNSTSTGKGGKGNDGNSTSSGKDGKGSDGNSKSSGKGEDVPTNGKGHKGKGISKNGYTEDLED